MNSSRGAGSSTWHLDAHLDPTALRGLADPATPARHWNLWTVLALEWWLARLAALPRSFAPEPNP